MKIEKKWWKEPVRIIQTNLQVKDTDKIKPDKLASEIEELGANTLVFNVGGIYAWYDTKIPFHNKNPYLPDEFDLLAKVIEACHKKDIKFIARFDFSKADDSIYLKHPEWFVRDVKNEPVTIGEKRPGNWTLLLKTCINSDYRNKAVAMPVINEVLTNYNIDGIFYNAPGYIPCYCNRCKNKYEELYNEQMPLNPKNIKKEWGLECFNDNINKLFTFIKNKNKNMPVILYYGLYEKNLSERQKITDMLCTEPQDVLSLGVENIPEYWKPAISIKLGNFLTDDLKPFGIVHSCPGMDWRHTGLPPSEYLFWLSQIPANGGQIWHSLTGVPDTITDKRILNTVSQINNMIKKAEKYMDNAKMVAQVGLIWNGTKYAEGLADGLMNHQYPFGIIPEQQISLNEMKKYKVILIPNGCAITDKYLRCLEEYMEGGGKLIIEGEINTGNNKIYKLLGINSETFTSEKLVASYFRFEESNILQRNMEDTELIPHRGKVYYCDIDTKQDAKILATLVPPFSPLESVGAPPERASLAVKKTDIPLCISNNYKKGQVLYFPFLLSNLINNYRLNEHYQLLSNAIDMLLGKEKILEITTYPGLQAHLFKNNDNWLINLVNGTGRRPLSRNIPLTNIEISFRINKEKFVNSIKDLINDEEIPFRKKENKITFKLSEIKVWKSIFIEIEGSENL